MRRINGSAVITGHAAGGALAQAACRLPIAHAFTANFQNARPPAFPARGAGRKGGAEGERQGTRGRMRALLPAASAGRCGMVCGTRAGGDPASMPDCARLCAGRKPCADREPPSRLALNVPVGVPARHLDFVLPMFLLIPEEFDPVKRRFDCIFTFCSELRQL